MSVTRLICLMPPKQFGGPGFAAHSHAGKGIEKRTFRYAIIANPPERGKWHLSLILRFLSLIVRPESSLLVRPKIFPVNQMPSRAKLIFLIALSATMLSASAAQTGSPLAVQNAGFESVQGGGIPTGWQRISPEAPGTSAGTAAEFKHAGTSSLRIEHPTPASTSLESSPVTLRIGRAYRLSAWARTSNVKSDPLARYPVAVPATLTMASFPFTNHSTTLGGSQEWTRLTTTFIATAQEDRVRLHLGFNGTATGTVWFDDVTVEEVTDIAELIPYESVRWFGPAFRYTDRGWTFVHIEGKPYERGYQYGYLLAQEIASYIDKLAVRATAENPQAGWDSMRMMADALMLRGYKEEYLEEMRGIADGAAKADAKFMSRPIDFLDIVTMNSAVDLGQLGGALAKTPHALSGKTFRLDEDEAAMQERLHKCSSFLANGPASADGKIVFGQLFMWSGYHGSALGYHLRRRPGPGPPARLSRRSPAGSTPAPTSTSTMPAS